jgi:hypothetical protein
MPLAVDLIRTSVAREEILGMGGGGEVVTFTELEEETCGKYSEKFIKCRTESVSIINSKTISCSWERERRSWNQEPQGSRQLVQLINFFVPSSCHSTFTHRIK